MLVLGIKCELSTIPEKQTLTYRGYCTPFIVVNLMFSQSSMDFDIDQCWVLLLVQTLVWVLFFASAFLSFDFFVPDIVSFVEVGVQYSVFMLLFVRPPIQ